MSDGNRVGVRELRQNLSVYLRRVAGGETLTVTEHRRPVAVLAPLPEDPIERRLTELGAIRAKGRLMDLPHPRIPLPPGVTTEDLIDEQRDERLDHV